MIYKEYSTIFPKTLQRHYKDITKKLLVMDFNFKLSIVQTKSCAAHSIPTFAFRRYGIIVTQARGFILLYALNITENMVF